MVEVMYHIFRPPLCTRWAKLPWQYGKILDGRSNALTHFCTPTRDPLAKETSSVYPLLWTIYQGSPKSQQMTGSEAICKRLRTFDMCKGSIARKAEIKKLVADIYLFIQWRIEVSLNGSVVQSVWTRPIICAQFYTSISTQYMSHLSVKRIINKPKPPASGDKSMDVESLDLGRAVFLRRSGDSSLNSYSPAW